MRKYIYATTAVFLISLSSAHANTILSLPVALQDTAATKPASSLNVSPTGSLGLFNTAPLDALFQIGNGTYNPSNDTGVLVSRNITSTTAPHGFAANDTVKQPVNGLGYASFDTRTRWTGSASYDHGVSYQSFPTFQSTGTMTNYVGFVHGLEVASGVVTNTYGIQLRDPSGAGSVTNNYGLYISSLGKGTASNYAIYTMSPAPSYFGGAINTDGMLNLRSGGGMRIFNTANTGYATFETNPAGDLTATAGASVQSVLNFRGANAVAFATFSGGWQERLRVTSTGNVGIGIANPSAKLHVVGTINAADIILAKHPTQPYACSTQTEGGIAYTGGTTHYLCFCNGSNWTLSTDNTTACTW